MSGWFERFARQLGKAAGPRVRKGRWLWHSLTGSEEEIVDAEVEVGRDLAAQFRKELGADGDDDPEHMLEAMLVSAVGGRLARHVRDENRQFTFTVAPTREMNAFALPGGHIFVSVPLLHLIEKNREEVAFVLGHEMAHVIKQHPMERLVSDTTLGTAMRGLRVGGGVVGHWLKSTGYRLMQSAYSRDQELVADKLGARLSEAAGYDPEAGIRMLERLQAVAAGSGRDGIGEYFATHPPFELRIAELRRFIAARKHGRRRH